MYICQFKINLHYITKEFEKFYIENISSIFNFLNTVCSLFRFQHWLLVCKRDDLLDEPITVVNEKYAVCADHFLANQFTDSLRKILKKNVVPSQFHKSNNEFLELLEGDEIIIEGKNKFIWIL